MRFLLPAVIALYGVMDAGLDVRLIVEASDDIHQVLVNNPAGPPAPADPRFLRIRVEIEP